LGRYLDPFVRLSWRNAELILVQNPETLALLPARYRARAQVLSNVGIDPRDVIRRIPAEGDELIVVTVGRLIHWKGCSLAIRALAASGLDFARLIVLGDGPERQRLRRLAAHLGVGDRVEFRGWVDRAALFEAFARADVVLFPSMHDEGGIGLVEAMAHGVIPVAIARGGPALIIGEAGFLSPVGRSVRETVAGLASNLRLAADPVARVRLRARARSRALEFAWNNKPVAMFHHLNQAEQLPAIDD
jgi:glycosyltransferase involved in cell wall biosynthesis